jgi:hypothetical protein
MTFTKSSVIPVAVIIAAIAVGVYYVANRTSDTPPNVSDDGVERRFVRDGLQTDTSQRSVELDLILDGGPGKDGIPAINEPLFVSFADTVEADDTPGILVVVGDDVRFYPYSILTWHEVVNDVVGDRPLVITFCPLCGSAIVFDAVVDGEAQMFGVSGKLFESNLVMYDRETESLWSQARGEAIVGELLGTKLDHYPAQLLTLGQVRENHPGAVVLSRETGTRRDYDLSPYGNYNESEQLIFPVSVQDTRFFAKKLMYVVPFGDVSLAFPFEELREAGSATVNAAGTILEATVTSGEISVGPVGGATLPGYYEMWFSWATHHQDDGVVWQPE